MGIGRIVNRVLRLLDARVVPIRHLNDLHDASARQAEQLAELDRACHVLRNRLDQSVVLPLDYREVVRPRPSEYRYVQVADLFERHAVGIDAFLDEVGPFLQHPALDAVPNEQVNDTEPYWRNGFFQGDDARLAYAVASRYNPATILEIGSGNSTKFFRKAIRDHGLGSRLVSIDPVPRVEIVGVADEVIRHSVLDVNPAVFQRLRPGDILFLDGSHLTLNGTDVVPFFLEVLPTLPAEVLVHVHDICLPHEYIDLFTERGYSEQYVLATLLVHAPDWVPLAPVAYLHRLGRLPEGGVSFWMKRVAA